MNTDRFFTLITDIDDKYIEEAENYKAKTSKLPVFISIAASALVLAGIAVTAVKLQKAGQIGTDETVPDTAVIESAAETFIGYIENNAAYARLHLLNYLQGEYPDDTVILSVTLSDAAYLNGSKGGYMPFDDQDKLKAALSKATAHTEDRQYEQFPWEDMRPIEVYYRHDGTTDNWIVANDGSLWGSRTSDTTEYDPFKNNYIPKEYAQDLVQLVMESYDFLEIDPITPDRIGDIKEAELNVEGQYYILTDTNKLKQLKECLTTAKPTTPSGCSWGTLELTLTYGQTITIALASDSCAIWHSDGKYYRYGSSDKAEEVYKLFDIDLSKLHAPKEE